MEYTYEKLVDAAAMTGTSVVTSEVFELANAKLWSYQITWTKSSGTLAGSYKVQVSNNPAAADDITDWADLSGATGSVTDASATAMVSFEDAPYKFARVVYTNATGVGVLNVHAISKG